MMSSKSLIFSILCFCIHFSWAQKDPVVFTVEGNPVLLSEFDYIYNKNNNDEQKYSESSVRDYLDLYIKFKLKVQAARDMGLDTVPSLQEELKGYQKQLAESYLSDKKIKESVYEEAYDRSLHDIEVQHIFSRLNKAKPQDTTEAYEKIAQAYKELEGGIDWKLAVAKFSDDKRSATTGGGIGYVNAPLPNGYYALENAIYNTPINKYSTPVKSLNGFHIVRPIKKRPARGEVEVAHILVRDKKSDEQWAKLRIDSIYSMLNTGTPWDDLVKKYTEDKNTKKKQGYLGWVSINKFELPFENTAFNLKEDGQFSRPIKTSFGYHIIKRISKKDTPDYAVARYELENKLKNSQRLEIAERKILDNIEKESGLMVNQNALERYKNSIDSTIFVFSWPGVSALPKAPLASMKDGSKIDATAFNDFLVKQKGKRLRMRKTVSPRGLVDILWQEYLDTQLMEYEKSKLAEKYPDFKALMREYDEGILLFEATRMKVWDYAGQDTTGLKNYFNAHQDKYQWEDRAELTTYIISSDLSSEAKAVQRFAQEKTPSEVYGRFSKGDVKVTYTTKLLEKDRLPEGLKMAEGADLLVPPGTGQRSYTLYKIESITPAGPRSYDESRGFVIADYQDVLEKEWIDELQKKYSVEVNEKTVQSIIQK